MLKRVAVSMFGLLMAVSIVGGCGKPFTVDLSVRAHVDVELHVDAPEG